MMKSTFARYIAAAAVALAVAGSLAEGQLEKAEKPHAVKAAPTVYVTAQR